MARSVILFVILSISLSFNTHAAENFNLKYLQSLFTSYQRQAAYDYALKHVREMEGDPYFDYFYGVSAIDTGHASEGVFALERVLLFHPNDHVVRLELALPQTAEKDRLKPLSARTAFFSQTKALPACDYRQA